MQAEHMSVEIWATYCRLKERDTLVLVYQHSISNTLINDSVLWHQSRLSGHRQATSVMRTTFHSGASVHPYPRTCSSALPNAHLDAQNHAPPLLRWRRGLDLKQ